jgi:phage replication O-like protein O
MANPQLEDGYTQIAHEIMEALAQINLSPYESRAIWFILRKTYGWKKKRDWIALSQFSKGLKLDRRHVHRALKGLLSKDIIVICRDDKKHPTCSFQKDYSQWKVSPVEMTKTKSVICTGTRLSSVQAPTKETLTKEIREETESDKLIPDFLTPKSKRKLTRPDPAALDAFERFYQVYPRHVGHEDALKAWLKLKPDVELIPIIMAAVERYAAEVRDTERRFVKHPGPWLNAKRWKDEPINGNGHAKPVQVKDLGNGMIEVDGRQMERALYEKRYGQHAN